MASSPQLDEPAKTELIGESELRKATQQSTDAAVRDYRMVSMVGDGPATFGRP